MADNDTTPKKVSYDVDSDTRVGAPEPFIAKVGGELVEFNDPAELDYRVLDRISDPETFAKYCVADDSRAHWRKQRLSVIKFRNLTRAYMDHYEVDELLGN